VYVAIRRTTVADHVRHLPRPKIVQEVLHRGTRAECQQLIDELAVLEQNQSTEDIEVLLTVQEDRKQKSYNSKEIRRDNGKRNTYRQP
jgi:hypothetical protein